MVHIIGTRAGDRSSERVRQTNVMMLVITPRLGWYGVKCLDQDERTGTASK